MKFFSNDGKVVEQPFLKFEASHILGKNHFYHVWMPILDGVKLKDTRRGPVPEDGTFKVVKSSSSGHYLIVPGTPDDEPNTFLAFITVESGMRGDAGLIQSDTTATVLYYRSTSVAWGGTATVAALLRDGQKVVMQSTGRRNNDIIVFQNRGGEIVRTDYRAEEYRTMVSPDGIAEEDWESV